MVSLTISLHVVGAASLSVSANGKLGFRWAFGPRPGQRPLGPKARRLTRLVKCSSLRPQSQRPKLSSQRMQKAAAANSCVKCALSSLGCSPVLRGAIDDLAVRIHAVAVRGTHLANHIIAQSASSLAERQVLTHYQIFQTSSIIHGGSIASKPRRILSLVNRTFCMSPLLDCSLVATAFGLGGRQDTPSIRYRKI